MPGWAGVSLKMEVDEMTRVHHILFLILVFLAATCTVAPTGLLAQSGKTKKSTSSVKPPKWFEVIPQDSLNLVARGRAQSKDQQVAVDKAVAAARDSMVFATEGPWKELVRGIREEGITAEEPARGAVTLHGSKIEEQKVSKRKKTWTAFVLVSLPNSSIPALLLERARSDSQWFDLVKDTRAVQELEARSRAAQ
jgi:hypothetical protein